MGSMLERDRGQALVETALLLPILCFGLIAGADLARAFSVQVGAQSAARIGAEAAVVLGLAATDPLIATHARSDFARVAGVNAASLAVTVTESTGAGGEKLVTVTAAYTFRTLVAWPLVPNTAAIQRTATMRRAT